MREVTKLLLVPHASTDWNEMGKYQGWRDIHLNQRGRKMANELARRLASEPIAAIYSSDLSRAMETVRAVWTTHQVPWYVEPRLREFRQPSDQRMLAMCDQVYDALESIAQAYVGMTVLVVMHGGPLRVFLRRIILDYADECRGLQCHVNRVNYLDGKWEVVTLDE